MRYPRKSDRDAAVTFVSFRFNRRDLHSLLIPFSADPSAWGKIRIGRKIARVLSRVSREKVAGQKKARKSSGSFDWPERYRKKIETEMREANCINEDRMNHRQPIVYAREGVRAWKAARVAARARRKSLPVARSIVKHATPPARARETRKTRAGRSPRPFVHLSIIIASFHDRFDGGRFARERIAMMADYRENRRFLYRLARLTLLLGYVT